MTAIPAIEGAPPGLVEEVWSDQAYGAIPWFWGGRVLDVGAGVGTFSLLAASNGCAVTAVEPDPHSRRLLEANMAGRDFTLIGRPAGDGKVVTLVPHGHGVITTTGVTWFPGCAQTSSVRLVDLLGDEEWDVAKVDCEGCEYPLLMGADLSPIRYLTVEFHVWANVPTPGLGLRPDPMPPDGPRRLLAWIERTHQVEVIGDPSFGGYLRAGRL